MQFHTRPKSTSDTVSLRDSGNATCALNVGFSTQPEQTPLWALEKEWLCPCQNHPKRSLSNACTHYKGEVRPHSIVYTDTFRAYDVLDVSVFKHVRINHSELFAQDRNHINGIENFWNQSKRHLRRYNGIPKEHFHLFLKECEWRFNYRPVANLNKTLVKWWFK